MTGAGNDMVALAAIDVARTLRPHFYSRIITPSERELFTHQLKGQLPFEHFVWLVWSVKESAYKFLKRFDPKLVFSPSKLNVEQLKYCDGNFEGIVSLDDHLLYSRSSVNKDYIFSVVNNENDFSDMHCEINEIDSTEPKDQSNAVRELLLSRLCEVFNEGDLQITKNSHGWPVIMNGAKELPVPVSFTHHGNFVAYTLNSTLWKVHAEIL